MVSAAILIEESHAGSHHAFLYSSILRRGLSIREGLPEAEVAHEHSNRSGNHLFHPAGCLPGRITPISGEILKCQRQIEEKNRQRKRAPPGPGLTRGGQ